MNRVSSSYRDPAGFVIQDGGTYKRVVTPRGKQDYDSFINSGLNRELVKARLVVDHEIEPSPELESQGGRLLVPEQIPFISYPFEWSFDELKDAALLTLEIQRRVLARGFVLKDASAYNVQFRGARPVFIDTLSFTRYQGGPWVAYEQFCRQFLGPLLVLSYYSPDAARFLKADLEGFSLERVSRLLPKRTYLQSGSLLHIHLHARAVRKKPLTSRAVSTQTAADLVCLTDSLQRAVEKIRTPHYAACWTNYYAEARFYSPEAQQAKRRVVKELSSQVAPRLIFDLGANTGAFAREIASPGALCIAFDSDPGCINRLYLEERTKPQSNILPLVMDLANPSPPLGFELGSTLSLFERPQADLVMCLALMHHLRVRCNLPLARIAHFLSRLGRWLMIEFIPLTDPAIRVLTSRLEDFDDCTLPSFLQCFTAHFELRASRRLPATERAIYLFERLPCAT